MKHLSFLALLFLFGCAQDEPLRTREFKGRNFLPVGLTGHLSVSLAQPQSRRPVYSVACANYSWNIPVVIDPYKYAGKPNNPQKLHVTYAQIASKTNAVIALNESAGGEDVVSCLLSINEDKAELFQIERGFRTVEKSTSAATPEYWYTWQVSNFSPGGVFMDNNTVFYKWSDLQMKHIGTYSGVRIDGPTAGKPPDATQPLH